MWYCYEIGLVAKKVTVDMRSFIGHAGRIVRTTKHGTYSLASLTGLGLGLTSGRGTVRATLTTLNQIICSLDGNNRRRTSIRTRLVTRISRLLTRGRGLRATVSGGHDHGAYHTYNGIGPRATACYGTYNGTLSWAGGEKR